MRLVVFLVLLLAFVGTVVRADTPVHCLYEQFKGPWVYFLGPAGQTNSIDCSKPFKVVEYFVVALNEIDVAVDERGNKGFWTMMYDEGAEVVINNKKFFAFAKWENSTTGNITSLCYETFNGWYHDIDGTNWGCFYGRKMGEVEPSQRQDSEAIPEHILDQQFVNDHQFIAEINRVQKFWTATAYPHYEERTIRDMLRIAGSNNRMVLPKKNKAAKTTQRVNLALPESFDWRNVNGVNYVSPIRDQGICGSCYAFGTLAMLEARTRIMTNNTDQVILSTQNVVSCSEYSQACDGGFPYLVGKFGEDFGLVEESCFPYTSGISGQNGECSARCQNPTYRYVTDYKYIGGYYGACTEQNMMEEIYANGPIAVSFEVYPDFKYYKSGIYTHVTELDAATFNPFQITNHVVSVVGWGVENGTKYWIVKNSWGTNWGENGFFRILRGADECNIESMCEASTPVLPK
eukprot:GEZU01026242.1.p1 GENE.GEZU01026242.1~~GEZU01026242.1.p1  ORF type:complete len:461 (-),score=134.83 GEZU01026242.1:970-2352(-)